MKTCINMKVVILVMLGFIIVGCKKSFLEIVPKGKLVATDYEDYNLLMNSSDFYNFNNIGIWQAAMLMGDDVSAEQSYLAQTNSPQARALFNWEANIFFPDRGSFGNISENPLFMQRIMGNIYTVNKIIKEVNSASGGTVTQKREIAAEAMVTRAFTNFQLVNYFGKPYSSATSANDPGFPIITEPDISARSFERGTVQDMYSFIIKDITTALPDLYLNPSFRTRWSKASAEALLGKVYVFMGNYTGALTNFNAAFADLRQMGVMPKLYNYNIELANGGAFFPVDAVYGPNTPFNAMTNLTESLVSIFSYSGNYDGNNFGNDFLTIDPETIRLFGTSDLRLQLFSNKNEDLSVISGGRVRRYTVPYSSYARIGIELSELYLLRAEARARTNDLQGAVEDLITLRKHRMPELNAQVEAAVANSQNALVRFIIDERSREFAGLGYRWWDMRRLSVDPLFSAQPAASHTIYNGNTSSGIVTLPIARLTLRFPSAYLQGQSEMPDNP